MNVVFALEFKYEKLKYGETNQKWIQRESLGGEKNLKQVHHTNPNLTQISYTKIFSFW